ncbi:MAG: serine hydrolase [Flavobacteriales bacterium]|nr:serine hydrolase [Flavobacteriales bacterium]
MKRGWIIKSGLLVITFTFALLQFNCEAFEEKDIVETIEQHLEITPKIVIADSTAYFDSVYAPTAFKLDTFFEKKFKATTFNGTVLFAERGRIILEKSYGFADWKKKDSLTIESTFNLASASKPFTSVAILQLVEQGKINLTDSVEKYIPSFPYEGIDIHQLLSHRSGLSKYDHFCDQPDSIWPDKNKSIHNTDVIDIMAAIIPQVAYSPNTHHYYSNTNYMLLAQIIENVSGVNYKDYLQTNIFDRCEMNNSVLYTRDNKDELINPAKGYTGNYTECIDIYLNGAVGDKGIYSNVEDMLKFDEALYNGTLLTDESLDLAFTEHIDQKNNGQNYGYGFRLTYDDVKGKIPFHTGWWKGFRTYFIRIPKMQQTIIILSNIKRGPFLNVNDLVNLLP